MTKPKLYYCTLDGTFLSKKEGEKIQLQIPKKSELKTPLKKESYLYLHGADVVSEDHLLARLTLLRRENAHLLEEGHILLRRVSLGGLHAAVDAPHARAGQLFQVGAVVAVAVEYRLCILILLTHLEIILSILTYIKNVLWEIVKIELQKSKCVQQ